MKKISIIIPCYNSQKYLNRCVDSVLNQTYKNFELILVDDGSTDNTNEILKAYAKKDQRVVHLTKANSGVGATRNFGIKHATGDYIQFLDSDDDMKPNMLERMMQTSKKTNADIVVCQFEHCCFKQFLKPGTYNMKREKDFENFYLDFFSFNVPWNKLFKREVITEMYDENLKIFEDGLFVLQNLKNVKKLVVIGDVLHNYFEAGINEDKKSLVNKFLESKFWKTQEGYWYKFNSIKPMFDKFLKEGNHNSKLLEYARSFDMAFWELIKLIHSGCLESICCIEFYNIFNEQNFINSIKSKGYKYDGTNIFKVKRFVLKCFDDYKNNTEKNVGVLYFKFVENFSNLVAEHKLAPSFMELLSAFFAPMMQFLPNFQEVK